MANQDDSDEKDTGNTATRLPSLLFAIGILCLIIGVILLTSTLFMATNSSEFFPTTVLSAILGGLAIFFGGHGYYLLPSDEKDRPAYFGSPILFQFVGVFDHILFFLVGFNGLIIADGINLDFDFFAIMTILFLPYVISRATTEWVGLRNRIWRLCKWEP